MAELQRLVRRKAKKKSRFNEQDYQREKQLRLQQLQGLSMFVDMTDHGKQDRIDRCENDIWEFARTYFPHYFVTETQADWHKTLHEASELKETLVAMAAPRGFAKSTFISFLKPLWWMIYQKRFFILLIMENESKAEMQTWRMLLELQHNERLRNDFGVLVSDVAARGDFATIANGDRPNATRIRALGTGMSARGIVSGQFRPDAIICDDLEDRALARNPARVAELLNLVLSDYLGSTSAEDWIFIWIGTIICRGSALDKILSDEEEVSQELNEHEVQEDEEAEDEQEDQAVVRYIFRAIERNDDGTERSTWEERHPIRKLRRRRRIMKWRFGAEYQNEPREEGGKFKESWFRHWATWPPDFDPRLVLIQIDPSFSDIGDCKAVGVGVKYSHSPEAAAKGLWLDTNGKPFGPGNYVVVLNIMNRKTTISDMVDTTIAWFKHYKAQEINIDGTYSQEYYFDDQFAAAEASAGITLPIFYQRFAEPKPDRIAKLESDVQRGFLVLPPRTKEYPDVEATIQQFTRLGESKINDDGPDMLSAMKDSLIALESPSSVII